MPRILLRWLERKRETPRAVLFREVASPDGHYLFGPKKQVYFTKALVGNAQRIVVKVEVVDDSGVPVPHP